jgi:hypothetical protein
MVLVIIIALVAFVTCMPWRDLAPAPEPEPTPVIETPSSAEPSPTPTPTPTPTPEPEPDPEPTAYIGPVNPLTGLPAEEDISDSRPFAFVINNIRKAMPQLGVSTADMIYEVPVEGGITRMLALYQDISKLGIIGSIRSSRTCFVDLAQSYDALFVFAGGSQQAYSALSKRDITRFDGVAGPRSEIFYRDQQRLSSMGYEHSLVTSGERITQRLPAYNNIRLTLDDGYERALSFVEDGTPENGAPAVDFNVSFGGGSKTTSFEYNTEDNLYYLSQYNSEYRDGNDKTQIAVTNVLILKTSISRISGDTAGRLDIRTTGHGSGYFICGGKYIEIDWSRAGLTSQFLYALKDGSELTLGQGKTYICIVSASVDVTLE